jgi:aminoglycoside phosphotransferase (APT) family kinase protein
MGNELLAMQTFGRVSMQNMRSVHAIAARKLPDGSGVLMMSPAKGEPIDNIMIRLGNATSRAERRSTLAELREAVRQNAVALVDLHTVPEGSGATEATALKRQINSAIGIAQEIGERVVSFNRDQEADARRLNLDIDRLVGRVDQLVSGVRRNPGPASLVHGDYHPGNIFFSSEAGITVIDSGRLTESMSENGLPIGSPARDLAAFTHKLGTFGVRYHLGEAEISELSKLFNRSYAAAGPATTPEAMQFFRARVALGAFLDALKRPASSLPI